MMHAAESLEKHIWGPSGRRSITGLMGDLSASHEKEREANQLSNHSMRSIAKEFDWVAK